ncbi:peptidase B [Klebsiella oxytoca]|nr:peptidase B [Klebsiella oxytoca]
MTEAMKITLTAQPADARWGEKASYSMNNDGIALHLNGKDDLGLIQRAARKIDGMGIKHVALDGEGWDTDRAWAFWAGYKGPKGSRKVEWPALDDAQKSELDNRLTIIDWVRDTINARSCWRWTITRLATKKLRYTPVWSAKALPLTQADTASSRAHLWTQ